MQIRPEDIGRFKSMDQAKAYSRAMEIKKEVQDKEELVMSFDNNERVDINGKAAGDVLIKSGWGMTGMHMKFDPKTKEVESFKAKDSYTPFKSIEHYVKQDPVSRLGRFLSSLSIGPFGAAMETACGAPQDTAGKDVFKYGAETVTVNNKTGVITYDMDRGSDWTTGQ
jgi:hypothetical protein